MQLIKLGDELYDLKETAEKKGTDWVISQLA